MSSQQERNARWAKKNKEQRKYLSYRSTTRTFIRNHASLEDIEEMRKLLAEREELLRKA
ncbi:hypothetical protein [Shouchella lehensis]|uniref:hypothetical protein n=1 Tax=Shouchella lehensis TaxID=300825 RepID=UPI00141A0560|nr:hypothetical protein [Shouchella lehensis]